MKVYFKKTKLVILFLLGCGIASAQVMHFRYQLVRTNA